MGTRSLAQKQNKKCTCIDFVLPWGKKKFKKSKLDVVRLAWPGDGYCTVYNKLTEIHQEFTENKGL